MAEVVSERSTVALLQQSIGNRAVAGLLGGRAPTARLARLIERAPDSSPAVTPGGTATAGGPAKKAPPAEETAMMAALGSMGAGGQHALQILNQYGISLVWVKTGAASFDGGSSCTISSTLAAGVAAGYFVHEMYHVEQKKTGASPDADATSVQARTADDSTRARLKKEYVDRMVTEEIEGTVKGYEARLGRPGPLMPGEEKYRSTYDYWIKAGKSDAEAKAMGHRRVELMLRPTDGTWPDLAPSQLESYEMYYKRLWNTANPPGAPTP